MTNEGIDRRQPINHEGTMTDPATVEKVARAICSDAYKDPHAWEAQSETVRDMYRRAARVMIPAYERAIKDAGMMICPLCSDCPPVGYPTDETRCTPCPRRAMIAASETADLASARGRG